MARLPKSPCMTCNKNCQGHTLCAVYDSWCRDVVSYNDSAYRLHQIDVTLCMILCVLIILSINTCGIKDSLSSIADNINDKAIDSVAVIHTGSHTEVDHE